MNTISCKRKRSTITVSQKQEVIKYHEIHPKSSQQGIKKQKERLTVTLAYNADGNEKPLVIGRVSKPRCFKNFNYKLYVNYNYNNKAWMNLSTFSRWMKDLDKKMRLQRQKILLIMDNVPGHNIPDKLTNVEVHFLPPTTTCYLQPLDPGIIYSFQSNFKQHQVDQIITQLDESSTYNITLTYAIRCIKTFATL
ncbi:tigger transposable element-derived protein 6-like [Octopus bimaculoides]|uniref:tigger transposable element-derived protein 6-like n=1 Tax=Octopus bimaculoides TaxID=37653 RepID=UPI00071C807B|nr:tigger transposable element-derived protein 6-like [Octopus bimaculoides]|eukprot:XP_014790750.1 PREDICTED: tigger transposable element-derived protein 6-like [Octopus bimaculoides]